MRKISLPLLAAALATSLGSATAAPPTPPQEGDRPGRYVLQPIDGGLLRMDTESGALTLCTRQGTTLACQPVQDDRAVGGDSDADRLRSENRDLKAEIRRLEDLLSSSGKPGSHDRTSRGPKFQLPTEGDIDKAMSYVDKMLRRFRERLKEFDNRGTQL